MGVLGAEGGRGWRIRRDFVVVVVVVVVGF